MAVDANKTILEEVNYNCPICEKKHKVEVFEEKTKVLIKNEPIEYKEIFYFCPKSNEEFCPENVLDQNLIRAMDRYRQIHGFLTSSEIKEIRKYYKLNQKEFSNLLGWGDITIQRYENKCVQDETYDEIIRRAKDNPFFVFEELNRHKDKFTNERFKEIEIYLKDLIRKGQTGYLKKEALKTLYIDFDKPSEFNGNKLLDFEKIEQMLRFFSQHNYNLYKVKLMKLLWYADAFHFKNTNQSISGLVYAHKTYGALPIGFNDLLYAFNDSISVTEEYFDCVGEEEEKITYKIKNLKNVDQNKLEPSEIVALDKVSSFFKKMGSKQISEYMHKEIAYNNTQDGTLISFKLAAKIKELN
jgi:putative zinc finger/helix-turn-helix YgiT family protein